jgi:hypothetical protein
MGGFAESCQRCASVLRLNAGMTTGVHMNTRTAPRTPNAVRSHRRVIADMIELALRGTVVAIAVAALAMGLIALAAS